TLLRAWRGIGRFGGRSALRSWLYRIATNVCLDMLNGRARRARPMDLGPDKAPVAENLHTLPEVTWIEPIPDNLVAAEADPAELAVERESIRLAFVAALQHLPPRQRAVLILCEVLRWKAKEVAELLETSVASVNSALQRARATLDASGVTSDDPAPPMDEAQRQLLARYVQAFERYDVKALTSLIREDAKQSMPPYDMWLRGRDNIFAWWFGPGSGCRDSRLLLTAAALGGQLQSRQRVNRDCVGVNASHVAKGKNGPVVLQQSADASAQARQIRRRERAPDSEGGDASLLRWHADDVQVIRRPIDGKLIGCRPVAGLT